MASIGHVAIGMAAARLRVGRSTGLARAMVTLSALSMLPDIDVVGFALGVPYGAPWGHRGACHSLAVAIAIGVVTALVVWLGGAGGAIRRALGLGVLVALVVASHGLLDAMTDGGKGVALLWPLTAHRYFLPWRPIPVAPIGAGFLSRRGMRVAAVEAIEFAPAFLFAFWPRRSSEEA